MSWAREKRLLLGWLALLAPLPLPFNDVIGWGALAVFAAAVLLFLRRAWEDRGPWLSFRAMNVLGLVYLPFLFADLGVLWRGRILQPLAHLVMFALVVKLFGMQRERDKWHAVFAVFFLFLAAAGTSVHLSVSLYLLLWMGLALYLLVRFAALERIARLAPRGTAPPRVPVRGFMVFAMAFVVLVSIPLFAFMPRLRQPYIAVPGVGSGVASGVSGQQEDLSLDFIGRIRGDRSVALRYQLESTPPAGWEARFRAGSYDHFEDNVWSRTERRGDTRIHVQRSVDGFFHLREGSARSWARIWLQPIGGTVLPVPVSAVAMDVPFGTLLTSVAVDEAGVVSLYGQPPGTFTYRVGLAGPTASDAPRREFRGRPPPRRRSSAGDLDATEVTPRIRELAREAAGEGSAVERARRIERHLLEGYGYTLDLLGVPGEHRVEEFLFRHRRGHCELFASAMVLMLRAEGIPARFVTGFLGAEYNPIESYFVVRQSNAHAWVEAEVADGAWEVFDPTPPSGRPLMDASGVGRMLGQVYDFLVFRWDRYVLTFGFADQVGMLFRFRDLWGALAAWLRSDGPSPETEAGPEDSAAAPESDPAPGGDLASPDVAAGWLSLLVLLLLVVGWLWWRRPGFTAAAAYTALRARLPAADRPAETLAPLDVARRLAVWRPEVADASAEVVRLYVRESFADHPLTAEEREDLLAAYREATAKRRKAS